MAKRYHGRFVQGMCKRNMKDTKLIARKQDVINRVAWKGKIRNGIDMKEKDVCE
jgi:hypothetical protein